MSLAVPLAVRVGNQHITREVSSVTFRKEAVGGLKSIGFRLARPLDRFDANLAAYATCYIYDAGSAETIAQGRLADFGRQAGADGRQWELVAFGLGQSAADRSIPYILVDQSLEPWKRSEYSTKNATTQTDERGIDTPVLQVEAPEGKTITTSWQGDWIYRAVRRADMKLARVRAAWDTGLTNVNYQVGLFIRTGSGGTAGASDSATSNTAGGLLFQTAGGTNFANGDDVCSLRFQRNTSSIAGGETHWARFYDITVRAMLMDATGADITTGYAQNYVLAHEVVVDLLGRVLDQFDGGSAVVDISGTHQIDQLAYPDGVTAEQVLSDLMILEPAFRWWVEPDPASTGYIFHWEPWPTVVRYEVTLEDGGDFPASAQELYNEVSIRWRDRDGRPRTTIIPKGTISCPILDDAGVTRSTTVDLGDEIGSAAAATRAGNNFLLEHRVPANAGTITIARPVRDLLTGRMVRPHEIEPGWLTRVRGVESYADALNPSSRDGATIFRLWSMTYNSDTDSAVCELDVPARSVTNALVKLAKRRPRKR